MGFKSFVLFVCLFCSDELRLLHHKGTMSRLLHHNQLQQVTRGPAAAGAAAEVIDTFHAIHHSNSGLGPAPHQTVMQKPRGGIIELLQFCLTTYSFCQPFDPWLATFCGLFMYVHALNVCYPCVSICSATTAMLALQPSSACVLPN